MADPIIQNYLLDTSVPVEKRKYVIDQIDSGTPEDELSGAISMKYGDKYKPAPGFGERFAKNLVEAPGKMLNIATALPKEAVKGIVNTGLDTATAIAKAGQKAQEAGQDIGSAIVDENLTPEQRYTKGVGGIVKGAQASFEGVAAPVTGVIENSSSPVKSGANFVMDKINGVSQSLADRYISSIESEFQTPLTKEERDTIYNSFNLLGNALAAKGGEEALNLAKIAKNGIDPQLMNTAADGVGNIIDKTADTISETGGRIKEKFNEIRTPNEPEITSESVASSSPVKPQSFLERALNKGIQLKDEYSAGIEDVNAKAKLRTTEMKTIAENKVPTPEPLDATPVDVTPVIERANSIVKQFNNRLSSDYELAMDDIVKKYGTKKIPFLKAQIRSIVNPALEKFSIEIRPANEGGGLKFDNSPFVDPMQQKIILRMLDQIRGLKDTSFNGFNTMRQRLFQLKNAADNMGGQTKALANEIYDAARTKITEKIPEAGIANKAYSSGKKILEPIEDKITESGLLNLNGKGKVGFEKALIDFENAAHDKGIVARGEIVDAAKKIIQESKLLKSEQAIKVKDAKFQQAKIKENLRSASKDILGDTSIRNKKIAEVLAEPGTLRKLLRNQNFKTAIISVLGVAGWNFLNNSTNN